MQKIDEEQQETVTTWQDVLVNPEKFKDRDFDPNDYLNGQTLVQVILDEPDRFQHLFRDLMTYNGLRVDGYIGDKTMLQYAAEKKNMVVFVKCASSALRAHDVDSRSFRHLMDYVKLLIPADLSDREHVIQMIEYESEGGDWVWDDEEEEEDVETLCYSDVPPTPAPDHEVLCVSAPTPAPDHEEKLEGLLTPIKRCTTVELLEKMDELKVVVAADDEHFVI